MQAYMANKGLHPGAGVDSTPVNEEL